MRFLLCILIAALMSGCQAWDQSVTDFRSGTTGLDRCVQLYDYSGHLIAQWNSKTVIDSDSGGLTTFFDSTGCRVLVNGGILLAIEKHR